MILKDKVWLNAKDYVIIFIGLSMYAFAFSAFIAPENVVIGGMAGIGQLIYLFLTRF